MALDFVMQWHETPSLPLAPVLQLDDQDVQFPVTACTKAIKWRQTVLRIVYDSLHQIERIQPAESDDIWLLEARLRALNYSHLALAELSVIQRRLTRPNRAAFDIAAISTLGGAYRLLAKCAGPTPVQCEHIFRNFLLNLMLAYAPACGQLEVGLEFCSLALPPIRCRALILCIGALIQGILRQSNNFGLGQHLEIVLSANDVAQYELCLRLTGHRIKLLGSPEFDLACRLSGIFESELVLRDAHDTGVDILLSFPAGSHH
jgi:hypothetical protein